MEGRRRPGAARGLVAVGVGAAGRAGRHQFQSVQAVQRRGSAAPPLASTESLTLVLQAAGVSLADFAALADDAPSAPSTVPLLGLARAGLDGFFDEAGLPTGDGWDQTELPQVNPTTFSLRISGDSMAPLYREGDRVIVDRGDPAVRRGDRVVARLTSGEVVAKELTALNARTATLSSINPDYPPRVVSRREIEWMARILWVSQ
jgi:phage repressor protein C with HTH and peptisase S24 domain